MANGNWFSKAFGFLESSNYSDDQTKIIKLFNGNTVNGIDIGNFKLVNGHMAQTKNSSGGKVTLSNISGDVTDLHKDPNNDGATFQVASQFNCLEMSGPNVTPEDGITRYKDDHTQGPACAICTPAGLAYREYLYIFSDNSTMVGHLKMGQTKTDQIDTSERARRIIKKLTGAEGKVTNGYLFYNGDELEKINGALEGLDMMELNYRRLIRQSILSGLHSGMGVCIDGKRYKHHVNHVYCSGLPISYSGVDHTLWAGLSELFLEAAYENTLINASLMAHASSPCYLTLVGGGAFGMNLGQIHRAIERACIVTARKGVVLDVKLVHHGSCDETKKTYTGTETFRQSIWDINRAKWADYLKH
jgi:hypothetical protein